VKAVEFESVVQDGQIELPPEIVGEIPQGEQLRVLVMWEPPSADAAWRNAGRKRFEAAYAPQDDVYEQLIDDSAGR
jgi:hypothetical protein